MIKSKTFQGNFSNRLSNIDTQINAFIQTESINRQDIIHVSHALGSNYINSNTGQEETMVSINIIYQQNP